MTRVLVTDLATRDVRNILSDLTQQAGYQVAASYAAEFEITFQRLADFPGSGAPRPALGHDMRIAIVMPYVVIYHYGEIVTVLRVLHGKRDINRNLLDR